MGSVSSYNRKAVFVSDVSLWLSVSSARPGSGRGPAGEAVEGAAGTLGRSGASVEAASGQSGACECEKFNNE